MAPKATCLITVARERLWRASREGESGALARVEGSRQRSRSSSLPDVSVVPWAAMVPGRELCLRTYVSISGRGRSDAQVYPFQVSGNFSNDKESKLRGQPVV